ncbi:MAG: hypothetical protein FJ276_22885, partial [Planctomycetes bacterium]|nr:hypothetical protein [Planctomycetota bacterium]
MVRPALRAFLPFVMLACVALILCLAMVVLFAVVDNAPWLSAFYNRYVLWIAASLHAGDVYWLLAFPFLVLWLGARTFHDRSPQDRNEKRLWIGISLLWGIAFLLGVIWIGAHSLLMASLVFSAVPLILRWVPRRFEAIVATALLCVLLGAAAWYLYWPWDYHRLYLWPLAPFLMLWGFIYLLLRVNWMYVGMYGAGRRQLRQYLQRHPRAESYFELLSHMRQLPEGAVYDQKPVMERIAAPDRPPRGLLRRWQLGLLDGLITLEARWPWLARRLRKYSPALGDSLIDSNPMLCGELEQLRGESLVAAETILYGDGGELPAIDTSACQLAEGHFARWLAYSDALVECCLFDVKLGERVTTPGLRGQLVLAAEICAEAARRCVNPTLRRAPHGKPPEWHWINDRAVACDRALAFLRREIFVLELLCGEKAKAPEDRTLHELMGLLTAGGDRQARVLRLRLIAAVLHFHAILGDMPGQSPRLLPTATNWNKLADEVDRCCNDTLRLPAAQLATQPDFAHLPDEAFVVLAARRRFIDVCGHWLAEDLLTARMNCWPGHPQPNDWQRNDWERHDSFARGLSRLRTAGSPGGRTYSANLERACN